MLKYQGGAVPEKSRKSINPEMGGRQSDRVESAVAAYLAIAADHGLDPVHMALAWCRTRPFIASAIFGATDVDQLAHILEGADLELAPEALAQIDHAHRAHAMPY